MQKINPRQPFSDNMANVIVLFLLFLLVLTCSILSDTASASLRFFGNANNDNDRVKIQLDILPPDSTPGPPADIGGEDFTLEFWMKASSNNTSTGGGTSCGANNNWIWGNIIVDRDRYSQGRNFGLSIVDGVLRFGTMNDASLATTICGSKNILDGFWHHVAMQRRRSDGQMELYVDGVLDAQADGPDGDISYPDDGQPGNYCNGPCNFSDPYLVFGAEKHDVADDFSGWIEEVRLSNTLRYPSNVPTERFITDVNTLALYHFNEGSGSIATDTSAATNGPSHGEIKSGVEWSIDTVFTAGGNNGVGVGYAHSPTQQLINVPNNTWLQISQGDVTAPANIMSYSGGWYDPQYHQFCIFGGGHWDYSGNEVWCLDIATLVWNEVYSADVVTTQAGDQGAYNNYNNTLYPGALFSSAGEPIENANPMSRHSYDQMEYVEGLGPVVWGGYMWGDGVTTNWCDMCKDTWALKLNNFNAPRWQYLYDTTNPSPNTTAGVGASAYSFKNKLMYALVTGDTWTFNPADKSWSQIVTTGSAPYSIEMTMEYDSKRNVLYTFGGTYPDNPNLYRFDIKSNVWSLLSPSGVGPGVETVRGPGLAYDAANDVLLVYKNGNIWAYDPTNNSWSQFNSASGPTADGWDAYGRFRYDPVNNGAWFHSLQNGLHTTWFYRYRNNGSAPPSPAPTITFSATSMVVQSGAQITLNWTSNASTCVASGDWSNNIASDGSIILTIVTNSNFTLTCSLNGVSSVRYINITIAEPITDSDSDGLLDSWELQYFGNLNSSATMDNDDDGLSNTEEFSLATNPIIPDTDGDGVNDGDEVAAGTDPLIANVTIPPNNNVNLVELNVDNQAISAQNNIPITFGHVFKVGDIAASDSIGARLGNNEIIQLQVDKKATHADGSLRHAVLTAMLPNINLGATQTLGLFAANNTLVGAKVSIENVLATTFDAAVTLNINGVVYSASARDLLQNTTPVTWLSGPLVSEWLVTGPLKLSTGTAHPHLTVHFAIRAFSDLNRVRVSVTLENTKTLVANPSLFRYDASVNIQGQGEVLAQNNVPHYRQGRWRRVFWWGQDPQLHLRHDKAYFELSRAIPTYDPKVTVPNYRLDEWLSLYNSNSGLMEFGLIEPYMPGGGARDRGDIAPLPGWTATWLLSQDSRAKTYMLGTDAQAGTFNIHFRDENTGYPIRTTDHSNWQAYVSDDSGNYYPPGLSDGFPSFATAEPSHEPDFAYVPYLVTGDYFYLEEMQFWASWNIMYGSSRDGVNGYVVWDQVRGQAWSLRSIAHAAYATPDTHNLKTYFLTILNNNRQRLENKWLLTQSNEFVWPSVGVNPLGFISNEDWLGYTNIMSTWMDDFLTWTVGHISALGFSEWQAFRDYKVRFPVGRTVDPASCWVLAPSYWPTIFDTYPGAANTATPVTSWSMWKNAIVYSSNNGSLVNAYGVDINLSGLELEFLASECASPQMYNYLTGVAQGEAISYSLPDSYIANLQAALAVAVEANYPNAQRAFDQIQAAANLPNYSTEGRPAWALVPYVGNQKPATVPSIMLNANPLSVEPNAASMLTWSVSNASSCSASGAWSGDQVFNGSVELQQLTQSGTYTMSCTGEGGTSSRSVTITVVAGSLPPIGNGESVGVDTVDDKTGAGALNIIALLGLFLICAILEKLRYTQVVFPKIGHIFSVAVLLKFKHYMKSME